MNPIIQKIEQRFNDGLSISAVYLEAIRPGCWQARLSFNVYVPDGEAGDALPCHTVTVDRDHLPGKITVHGLERWPDESFPVQCLNDEYAEAMLAEVARIGQAQDIAKFTDGGTRFLTKPNKWFRVNA